MMINNQLAEQACVATWKPHSEELEPSSLIPLDASCYAMATADETSTLAASSHSTVLLLDLFTERILDKLKGHTNVIWDLISVGHSLVSCGSDKKIITWVRLIAIII
jgi:hypothetical protein